MKIRTGFVSNSSTSSFLVVVKELSADLISKLRQRGYKYTNKNFHQGYSSYEPLKDESDNGKFLRGKIPLNQDEEIYYLIKNNIPFSAEIEYGREHIRFVNDKIYSGHNYGKEYLSTNTFDDKILDIIIKDIEKSDQIGAMEVQTKEVFMKELENYGVGQDIEDIEE